MNTEEIKKRLVYGLDGDISTRFTMLPEDCINNVEFTLNDCITNNIEGDFVETGVWKGGTCIFANHIIKKTGSDKKVYAYDSFEGLPKPNGKYPKDDGDPHWTLEILKVSLEDVKKNFEEFNLLDSNVIFVKGWFKDTMPINNIDKICVLRLDGDMYESTIDVLEFLYPKLSVGGYCIIDDYHPNFGAHHAVNDYIKKYNIKANINIVYPSCPLCFWKKTE